VHASAEAQLYQKRCVEAHQRLADLEAALTQLVPRAQLDQATASLQSLAAHHSETLATLHRQRSMLEVSEARWMGSIAVVHSCNAKAQAKQLQHQATAADAQLRASET
jgi:hypothetical protein